MQIVITEQTVERLNAVATSFATESSSPQLGVFDSGVGGLEVVNAIVTQLQHHARVSTTDLPWPLLFLGDTARFPFGEKTTDELIEITLSNCEWLVAHQSTHIVIACNTASIIWEALLSQSSLSANAHRILTSHVWTTITPAAQAVARLQPHTVGVIATQFTVHSGEYARLIQQYAHTQPLVVQSAQQDLIEAIQRGDQQAMHQEVQRLSSAFASQQLDVLVLGCTHYGHVIDAVAQAVGNDVILIDPARILGEVVAKQLSVNSLGQISIHWTGSPSAIPALLAPLVKIV